MAAGGSFKRFEFGSTESRRDTVLSATTAAQPFVLSAATSKLANMGTGFGAPDGLDFTFITPAIDSIATQVGLGVECYFARESLLSVAVFYKDIRSFVTHETASVPFNELGLPDSLLTGTPSSPDNIHSVTRNVNGTGGELKGLEIQYQQPFYFLPGVLKNFGFIGNLTLLDSEVSYGTAANPILAQLTGLWKTGFNTTLYYEDDRFSARVSGAYRSSFLTRVPGQNGNDVEGTAATFNIDAAMSYALTDQIKPTVEAINITDEIRKQYVDSVGQRPVTYNHTGRSFLIGARFTM